MVSVFDKSIPKKILAILCNSAQLYLDDNITEALDVLFVIDDVNLLRGISINLLVDNAIIGNMEKVIKIIKNTNQFSECIIKKMLLNLYKKNSTNMVDIIRQLCEIDNPDIYLCALLLNGDYEKAKLTEFSKPKSVALAKSTKSVTSNITGNVFAEIEDSYADNYTICRNTYNKSSDILNPDILKTYTEIFYFKKYQDLNIQKIIDFYLKHKLNFSETTREIYLELFYKLAHKLLDSKNYNMFIPLMMSNEANYNYDEKYEFLIKQYFLTMGEDGFKNYKDNEWSKKYIKLCLNDTIAKFRGCSKYAKTELKKINKKNSHIVSLAKEGKKNEVFKIIINDLNMTSEVSYAMSLIFNFDEIQKIYKIIISKSKKERDSISLLNNIKNTCMKLFEKIEDIDNYILDSKYLDNTLIQLESSRYIDKNFNISLIQFLIMNDKCDDSYKLFKFTHGDKPNYCSRGECGECVCVYNFDIKTYPTDYLSVWLNDWNFLINFNHYMKKFNKNIDIKNYKTYLEFTKASGQYTDCIQEIMLLNLAGFYLDPSIIRGRWAHSLTLD